MKVVIVQFYSYHEEVIAPQLDFLLPDNELFVAAPPSVLQNDYISFFIKQIKTIEFKETALSNNKIINLFLRFFSILCKYIQLYTMHKKEHFRLIIFNTINKPFHFVFIKLFFKCVDKIHIIHNADHYLTPDRIKQLYLFKKNLFISADVHRYFLDEVGNMAAPSLFDWFLPVLSGIPTTDNNAGILPDDKITIVVPGSVKDYRRNYSGLFNALKSLSVHEFPFSIILLGKISPEKQREIDTMGLGHVIKTFTEYVPGQDMLYFIKNADAIAFLIDSGIGDNIRLYNKYKASGSSILCLTFAVPCIVSDHFNIDSDLKEKAIIYPGIHIERVFNSIISGEITKSHFKKLKSIPLPHQYARDYQKKHYRKLIGLE
jgi:hypothetical protein